jgi:hypothetical protein
MIWPNVRRPPDPEPDMDRPEKGRRSVQFRVLYWHGSWEQSRFGDPLRFIQRHIPHGSCFGSRHGECMAGAARFVVRNMMSGVREGGAFSEMITRTAQG